MEALQGDTLKIIAFLRGIGLTVRIATLNDASFLPGIMLENGGLVIDPKKLLYPGDLLHEAGHLAVMTTERRHSCDGDVGTQIADEIGAQCWSYAAAVHLGLPPETVFHEDGYKGSAQSLIERYRVGHVGLPLLQWMGFTLDRKKAAEAGVEPYPHMLRWLRDTPTTD